MLTSRTFYLGLADSWSTSEQALERACRPLKPAGLWPTGTRGRGPAGDGVQTSHLAALLLGQAGDQPSDCLTSFLQLADLTAALVAKPNAGPMAKFAPANGACLAQYLTGLINTLVKIDPESLAAAEAAAERADWTLSVAIRPAMAFMKWNAGKTTHRVNFLADQPELLAEAAPARIRRVTVIPFRSIAAAAQLQAENLGLAVAASISDSGIGVLGSTPPGNENAASPAREKAAKSSETKALTAEPGRSALEQGRKYPTSRGLRKGCDSDSLVRAGLSRDPDSDCSIAVSA